MSKPILVGVIVVALAAGVGGYAVMAGAPAAPKGGCPALVSMAPYDANFIAYGDFATMRNSSLAHKMNTGANNPALPKEYQDFVAQTNFHFETDLEHIMVEGSVDSAAGGLVLEGKFDQPKISDFVAKFGTKTHYEAGDVYMFPTHTATGSVALMFIDPKRLAITMGKSAETQALLLADAAHNSDTSAHEDMCARAERVAGAPFFMIGDMPKSAGLAMAALAAKNSEVTDVLQPLQGWDFATWTDGNNLRMEIEGDYGSRLDALKARIAFEKVRKQIQQAESQAKTGLMANSPATPAIESLIKNFGISLDGRFVRMSTSLSHSDLEGIQRAATSMAPAMGMGMGMGMPATPPKRGR
jgi:hypothetical protein